MTPQLKQRLIGAAVMVAGAVIFIPMLLDEDALQSSFDRDRLEVTPPAPTRVIETSTLDNGMLERAERGARNAPSAAAGEVFRPRLPPDPEESTNRNESPVPAAAAPTTPANNSKTAAMPRAATPVTQPAMQPRADDGARLLRAGTATAPGKAPTVASTSPPALPEATREPEAWVVQLGVYRDETTARALEQRLREAGYKAFVDLVSADGASYRVRVGPEAKRANAETTRAQLQQLLRLNGFVIPHP